MCHENRDFDNADVPHVMKCLKFSMRNQDSKKENDRIVESETIQKSQHHANV